jgi:chorismate mutase/prephenate dehydratase
VKELDRLRKNIDKLDDEILERLNRRSEIVIEVGHIKRTQKSRFYKPNRERQISKATTAIMAFPMTPEGDIQEILSASVSLKNPEGLLSQALDILTAACVTSAPRLLSCLLTAQRGL